MRGLWFYCCLCDGSTVLQGYKEKPHSCSRLYYATKNDESHLVWEAISSLKLLRPYSLKLLNFITELHFTARNPTSKPPPWKQAVRWVIFAAYNIPDRLVSWSPKLISLVIIKGLVLSTTKSNRVSSQEVIDCAAKRHNRILNFIHFSLLTLSIGYLWDMQIQINKNKSEIKQENGI